MGKQFYSIQIERSLLTIVSILFLSGCAATGGSYQDMSLSITPVKDKTRLVLFRTKDSLAGSGRTTAVKIDGKSVQGVKYGGFTIFDEDIGDHIITVDLPDTYGKCLLPVHLEADHIYYFEIKPRLESLNLGGGVGEALKAMNEKSPNREDCKGSFFIVHADEPDALEKLKTLKSSN